MPSQYSARGTLCDVCGCLQFLVLRCLKIQHSPIFCDVFRDVFCAASPTYAIESSSYWASQVYGRRVALRLHAPALSSCIGASCLQLCIALRFAKIVLLLYRQSLMGCSQETRGVARSCFWAQGHTRVWNRLRDSNYDTLQQIHKKEAGRTTAQSHTISLCHTTLSKLSRRNRVRNERAKRRQRTSGSSGFWMYILSEFAICVLTFLYLLKVQIADVSGGCRKDGSSKTKTLQLSHIIFLNTAAYCTFFRFRTSGPVSPACRSNFLEQNPETGIPSESQVR